MKTVILFSLLSLAFSGDHPQKHSNLLEWGIKGKVKSIKMYSFEDLSIENDSILADTFNLENWDRFAHTYYNKEGMTDSMIIYRHQQVAPVRYIMSYQPDTTITYQVIEQDTMLFSKSFWLSKFSYQMNLFDDGELKHRDTYTLNNDFSISEVHYEFFESDQKTVSFDFYDKIYFNEHNRLDSVLTYSESIKNEVVTNRDLEIDEHGTAIKSIKTYNNESRRIIIREVEYY